jgi:WbqC-like protein
VIVAIHQPLFAPWSGYFHKMLLADRFVVLDQVAYTHHNRINRNEIRLADGRRSWLTVPVRTRGRDGEPILAVEIAERENPRWRDKHLRTLRQHYGSAPHFAAYAPEIEAIYAQAHARLVDLDLALLACLRRALGIRTPLVRSSELGATGDKSRLLVDLCRRVGGSVYLAGMGGSRTYLEEEVFGAAGVRVAYQEFAHPVYRQGMLPFEANLSALDLLFHRGADAGALLRAAGPGPAEAPRVVHHA